MVLVSMIRKGKLATRDTIKEGSQERERQEEGEKKERKHKGTRSVTQT